MKTNNNTQVLIRLVDELNIPVTRKTIRDELSTHPDQGSLLAFSDLLSAWHVPNAAYQLTFEQLAEVPLPFITYTKKGFVTVTQLDDKQATLSNEKYTNEIVPLDEFKNSYSGPVLMAEKKPGAGEPDYPRNGRIFIQDLRAV